MKAWRVEALGHPSQSLELQDIAVTPPGPGEVAIDVAAGTINFADILLCQGIYQDRPGVPLTPGLESAGIVTAVGEGVDVAIGARVAGMCALPHGGYAEHALLRGPGVLEFPDDIPFDVATVLYSTYQTSHVALHHRGQLAQGETLLVHAGAGGVGSAAIQLGVAAGARVIATAGGAEKVAICRELGAHEVIDYREADLYARLMALTDGNGVDVAYDPVGGAVAEPTRRAMAWEGRLLVIGFAGGDIPTYPSNHILVKNYSVVGVHWGAYTGRNRAVVEAAHADLISLYRQGAIAPRIQARVPLAGIPDALTLLENRGVKGRLVVAPQD
ncbi:MAG: NADPH:quinone oxidoreductase family protein [Pseudomonadota bacterium]